MNGAPILEARDLKVRRGGTQVLDVPSLALCAGEVLALIGPNGAGKTTLMLALACLVKPFEGSILFRGETLDSRPRREGYRQRVGMVFQDPLLFDATVQTNIGSGLKLRGIPKDERERRVLQAAQRFGVAHLLKRSARKLSGGEAQRTSLARAFVLEPEVIFLDEPFTSLDPPTREALLDDLAHILEETGTGAVFSTHEQSEALRLADRLAVLHQGRVVQAGRVSEVINHPADEFVAAFVGMETVVEGVVGSCEKGVFTVRVSGQDLHAVGEATQGQAVLVGVRPENVTLTLHRGAESSARNVFPGTLTRIVPKGPFFKVELDCGFFLSAYVTARSLEELELREGKRLTASFKATAVHVIRK